MSTLHFTLALIVGTYAYALLPDWTGFMLLTSAYVVWQSWREDPTVFTDVIIDMKILFKRSES